MIARNKPHRLLVNHQPWSPPLPLRQRVIAKWSGRTMWLFHLEGEGKGGVEVEVEEKVEEVGVAEVQGVGEGVVQGKEGEEEGEEEGGGEGGTQHNKRWFCIPLT